MFSILKLAKVLGGTQWVQYDRTYREWPAAKGIRVWGELNIQMFGECLAPQLRSCSLPIWGIQQWKTLQGSKRKEPSPQCKAVAFGTSRESVIGKNVVFPTRATTVGAIIELLSALSTPHSSWYSMNLTRNLDLNLVRVHFVFNHMLKNKSWL